MKHLCLSRVRHPWLRCNKLGCGASMDPPRNGRDDRAKLIELCRYGRRLLGRHKPREASWSDPLQALRPGILKNPLLERRVSDLLRQVVLRQDIHREYIEDESARASIP